MDTLYIFHSFSFVVGCGGLSDESSSCNSPFRPASANLTEATLNIAQAKSVLSLVGLPSGLLAAHATEKSKLF